MKNSLRALAASFHSASIPVSLEVMITCVSVANEFQWLLDENHGGSPSPDAFYDKACGGYVPYMQTSTDCFVHYNSDSISLNDSLASYQRYCNAFSKSQLSFGQVYSIWSNGTRYLKNASDIDTSKYISTPFILPEHVVTPNLNSFHYIYYNFAAAFNFSIIINSLVFATLALLYLTKNTRLNNRVLRYIRSKFLIPPISGTTHHTETKLLHWYTTILPTRGEFVFLAFFVVINVILASYNYPLFKTKNEGKGIFLLKCVANRTGGLSFGLIPLIILLAGRNNLVQHMTGLPYSSMIFFHKWVARTMTFYGVLHGTLWCLYAFLEKAGLFRFYFENFSYWRWGIYISGAAVALLIQSIYCIKSRHYEIFLILHISLALFFLVGCYYHCEELGWTGWIFLSSGLWVIDRILRFWNICYKFGGYRHAHASIMSNENKIFKITIPNVDFEKFEFFPGCFAYLYVKGRKWFWQSHPFTLLKHGSDIEIVIKAKEGLTKNLFELLPTDGTRIPIRVALEGPYGHEAPVTDYSDVLLLTSGTGIPGPISYLEKVIEQQEKVRKLHFVWIVPNEDFVNLMKENISDIFQKVSMGGMSVNIDFFVTRPRDVIDISWLPSEIHVHKGRPNIKVLIEEDLSNSTGDVAVVSCAIPQLDDEIRSCIGHSLPLNKHITHYYDELQVW